MGKKREVMRVHSRYENFPDDVKALIDKRLRNAELTYTAIANEITDMGHTISRSAIGRVAFKRNKETRAMEIRLEVSRERAKIAMEFAKDGNSTDYAKAAISIVMNELVNRVLAASADEYDDMDMKEVFASMSRLIRDMTGISKLEFSQEKGKKAALEQMEAVVEQYMEDDPEAKARIMAAVNLTLD